MKFHEIFMESHEIGFDRKSRVTAVDADLIQWNMLKQVIPVIPAHGETAQGQVVSLDLWDVVSAVSKQQQPLKVIRIHCGGGFQDEHGQVDQCFLCNDNNTVNLGL
jgi:acetylglutamate kinase